MVWGRHNAVDLVTRRQALVGVQKVENGPSELEEAYEVAHPVQM